MSGELEFERVTKRYGSVVAVDGISFRIAAGTLVTLLGPSGCGKTSTLRMIAGLELASEGRVRIGGKDVTHLPANERNVTMVFQSYALFPHLSVLENVSYGLVVRRRPAAEVRDRAEGALSLVGLGGLGLRKPSELSGGQQQRVAVARALVLEPEILLFDEPLSNLDARLRRRMREEIRSIQQKLKLTAVYVTHDQSEALAVSDQVILMSAGKIAQRGAPRELYESPESEFVASFIGESSMLSAEISRIEGEVALVSVGGAELRLPSRGIGMGPAKLAVRPNAAVLSPEPPGIPGQLVSAVYLGSHMEYELETSAGELLVSTPDVSSVLEPGQPAFARVAGPGAVLVRQS
ncbi:MAG: ABC transporter ATP-binding protein [Deltaproteobacteria bacterium]|nr:ABC transporter ATP-binding protein [Deltaproteobacteria bacterium]